MKTLLLGLFIAVLLCSCSMEELEGSTTTKIIGQLIYCDIELYNGDCWSDNDSVWNTIDLSDIVSGQTLVEVEVVHSGGDVTETIICEFRKSEGSQTYNASSRNDDYTGYAMFNTDSDSSFEWQHTWGAEEARKINLTLKLKMY